MEGAFDRRLLLLRANLVGCEEAGDRWLPRIRHCRAGWNGGTELAQPSVLFLARAGREKGQTPVGLSERTIRQQPKQQIDADL
jgi:hypothetical protein